VSCYFSHYAIQKIRKRSTDRKLVKRSGLTDMFAALLSVGSRSHRLHMWILGRPTVLFRKLQLLICD
jgi:hypothetical protein